MAVVEEDVRGVNDLLIATVGAALSALIAYPLGRAQGKQQTVFEEQAKVMGDLRRMVLEVDVDLFLASMSPYDEQTVDSLLRKIAAMQHYHREKSIWLEKRLNDKIASAIDSYDAQAQSLVTGEYGGAQPREIEEHRASRKVRSWRVVEGKALVDELETEARKLLGVDSSPWWRRVFGS